MAKIKKQQTILNPPILNDYFNAESVHEIMKSVKEDFKFTLVRTLAFMQLSQNNELGLEDIYSDYLDNIRKQINNAREFNEFPYSIMVKEPAEVLGLNLDVINDYSSIKERKYLELGLISITDYIARIIWNDIEFLSGFGMIYFRKGKLFSNSELQIFPQNLAPVFFLLKDTSLEEISNSYPKLAIIFERLKFKQKSLKESIE